MKLKSNILFLILFTFLVTSTVYFGVFILPKIYKLRNIAYSSRVISIHKLDLISIRVAILGIAELKNSTPDLADKKDFYILGIKDGLSDASLNQFMSKTGDEKEIKDLSSKLYTQLSSWSSQLESFDLVYGRIIDYDPVLDLGSDLGARDFNSIVGKTDESIEFFVKIRSEQEKIENINPTLDDLIEILKKIKLSADTENQDKQLESYISEYDIKFSNLKSKILGYYHSLIISDNGLILITDLSNLINMEENYLNKLEFEKKTIISSLR